MQVRLDTSTATKFVASFGTIFSGAWAKYRQALRDLPSQEGFPFEVKFPTPPDSEKDIKIEQGDEFEDEN